MAGDFYSFLDLAFFLLVVDISCLVAWFGALVQRREVGDAEGGGRCFGLCLDCVW